MSMNNIVSERIVDCSVCRGRGIVQARPGCAFCRCLPCQGRGFFYVTISRQRLVVPSIPACEHGQEGGEKAIKVLALTILYALSASCTFDYDALRGHRVATSLLDGGAVDAAEEAPRVADVSQGTPDLAPDISLGTSDLAPDKVHAPDVMTTMPICRVESGVGKQWLPVGCPSGSRTNYVCGTQARAGTPTPVSIPCWFCDWSDPGASPCPADQSGIVSVFVNSCSECPQ